MEPPTAPQARQTVDVTGLLCAQALMAVMKAVKTLAPGGVLDIRFNSDDVKRDLSTWAVELGHTIISVEEPEAASAGRLVVKKEAAA